MDRDQIRELVLQALETERGGQQVYEAALACARNPALREAWERYRRETARHELVAVRLCLALNVDPEEESPGRGIARLLGQGLVDAIRRAADTARPEAAQAAAAECVALAETKDHLHWELIGHCAQHAKGEAKRALQAAYAEVEPEEGRHLREAETWVRELWLASLGLPAKLPPGEG
jgi:rubrerythrin